MAKTVAITMTRAVTTGLSKGINFFTTAPVSGEPSAVNKGSANSMMRIARAKGPDVTNTGYGR